MTYVDPRLDAASPEQFERIVALRNVQVSYPKFLRAFAKIERFMHTCTLGGDARGILLTGPTGVGKSTMIEALMSHHPNKSEAEREVKPIVHGTVKSPAGIRNVAASILKGFGIKDDRGDSAGDHTGRIQELIKGCGTQMLIIDEFQDLCTAPTSTKTKHVSDWIKGLISETNVAALLAGLPETEDILRANPQLNNRFPYHVRLTPFSWESDKAEFGNFLAGLEKGYAPILPIRLTNGDLPARLMLASGGVLRPLMTLIRETLTTAVFNGLSECGQRELEEKFADMRASAGNGAPFQMTMAEVRRRLLEIE